MGIVGRSNSVINIQQQTVKRRRKAMLKVKPATAAIYAGVFLLVVSIVFTSYQAPQKDSTVANAANVGSQIINQPSVDDVVAAGVAASVAQAANLPVANDVFNLAISAQIKSDFNAAGGANSVKPQIIGSTVTGRSITDYTVKAGESVDTIAAAFGLSKNTIKWANDLAYDNVYEGTVIKILPVDGVIYHVKYSDTLDSIASKYGVSKEQIILYNDLDVSGLVGDAKIILPGATLPENERPGYYSYSSFIGYGDVVNRYTWGNCTWYAYERRVQLGLPVGSMWGNANTWAYSAQMAGYRVDNIPSAGAIYTSQAGWAGHVAIVESVEPNGDVNISEMNALGLNVISSRTISADQAVNFRYIH